MGTSQFSSHDKQPGEKPVFSTGKNWTKRGLIMILIGIVIMIIFRSLFNQPSFKHAFFIGGFIFVCGLFFMMHGEYKRTKAKQYEQYIHFIQNGGVRSIDVLAELIKVPYEIAVIDIKTLIQKGFLPNIHILEKKRELMYIKGQTTVQSHITINIGNHAPKTPGMVVVECKGCGASSTLAEGAVGECEFCGTSIAAK